MKFFQITNKYIIIITGILLFLNNQIHSFENLSSSLSLSGSNNKIFESFQKHRKHLKQNLPSLMSPKSNMNGKLDSITNKDPVARGSNIMQTALNSVTKNNANLELGQGPIFFNGWIKYFKYVESNNTKKPSSFFKNVQFEEQSKLYPEADLQEKEGNEYKYINKNTYFYSVLFKDNLNIAASRIVQIYITI